MAFDDQVTIAAFAERVGVTRQAAEKAIRAGRIPAYDATGAASAPGARGRKWLRLAEACASWNLSRARVDDPVLAEIDADLEPTFSDRGPRGGGQVPSKSLTAAKTEREEIQVEYLKQRLARERGELISRLAALEAFEAAGSNLRRKLDGAQFWAEELAAAAQSGGANAIAQLLREKILNLQTEIADSLEADLTDLGRDDDEGPDHVEAA